MIRRNKEPQKRVLVDPDEFKLRLNNCINELNRTYPKATSELKKELFTLHNLYWLRQETGMHCGACVNKVLNTMRKVNEELQNEKEQ